MGTEVAVEDAHSSNFFRMAIGLPVLKSEPWNSTMSLKRIMREEGVTRAASRRVAGESFEVTSVPAELQHETVRDLSPGTVLTNEGKYFGVAIQGGYAHLDGNYVVITELDYFNPRKVTSYRLSKQSIGIIKNL